MEDGPAVALATTPGLQQRVYRPVTFQPDSSPTVVKGTMSSGMKITLTSKVTASKVSSLACQQTSSSSVPPGTKSTEERIQRKEPYLPVTVRSVAPTAKESLSANQTVPSTSAQCPAADEFLSACNALAKHQRPKSPLVKSRSVDFVHSEPEINGVTEAAILNALSEAGVAPLTHTMVSRQERWIPSEQPPVIHSASNGTDSSQAASNKPAGQGFPKSQNPTITLLQKSRDVPSSPAFTTGTGSHGDANSPTAKPTGQLPKGPAYSDVKDRPSSSRPAYRRSSSLKSKGSSPGQKQWYRHMFQSMHRTDSKVTDMFDPYLPTHNNNNVKSVRQHSDDITPSPPPHSDDITPSPPPHSDDVTPSPPHSDDIIPSPPLITGNPKLTNCATSPVGEHGGSTTITDIGSPSAAWALRDSIGDSQSTASTTDSNTSLPTADKTSYRQVQQGGEIPYSGFRKPAPVASHPKEPKPTPPEPVAGYNRAPSPLNREQRDEQDSKRRQIMRQIEEEEKRRKTQEERSKLMARRHHDNLIPKEKTPIRSDRFDSFEVPPPVRSPSASSRPSQSRRTGELRAQAVALYTFKAQNSKELSFNKGDTVYLLRQVDANWYEGEHYGMMGIFPVNYVQVTVTLEQAAAACFGVMEGLGRAKYHFQSQTSVELPLVKGEAVILIRQVDSNWYEGRSNDRIGIFPISYVDVLAEPRMASTKPALPSPTLSPHPTVDQRRHSLQAPLSPRLSKSQNYPTSPRSSILRQQSTPPMRVTRDSVSGPSVTVYPTHPGEFSGLESAGRAQTSPNSSHSHGTGDELTSGLDMPSYKILYNYHAQKADELELREGDVVHVTEKCADGWYVGTSGRTGAFGTFPGNYAAPI